MFQYIFFTIRIPETHIPKLDIPADRFPVFPLRLCRITIPFQHLRCIGNIRFLLQQIRHSFYIGLARNHIRQESCQLLDRFKDSHCVRQKYRQRTQCNDLMLHKISATRQHECCHHGTKEQNHRHIDCRKSGKCHGVRLHPSGHITKCMII